jgi:hypothetical protein
MVDSTQYSIIPIFHFSSYGTNLNSNPSCPSCLLGTLRRRASWFKSFQYLTSSSETVVFGEVVAVDSF